MRRRYFITLIGGAAAGWPLAARAQQSERMRRVGVLMNATWDDPRTQTRVKALTQHLHQLGWIEGVNLRTDYRVSGRDPAVVQAGAKELVGLQPDVIITGSTVAAKAAQSETATVPIVMAGASDPLGSGLVKSLSHPGGNLTGFSNFEFSVGGKMLELLKQVAPAVNRVLVIMQPGNDGNVGLWRAIESAGPALSVRLSTLDEDSVALEREITAFAREPDLASSCCQIRPRPYVS
jgi:putative ABC transport system substrate-binding protein